MTFITLGFKNNVITDGTFITLGFKCYYMMGPLLHLGPVITLVPSYVWYPDQWVSPYFIRSMRAEPRD